MQPSGHRKQLPQSNIRLRWIVQGDRFGEVFRIEDFGIEPFRNRRLLFGEHDTGGDADVGFAHRGRSGIGLTMAAAVIAFIH